MTAFYILAITMTGLTIFVLFYDEYKMKSNCDVLITAEKVVYKDAYHPEDHDWEGFNYYWDLPAYSCDQFYDKMQVLKEIKELRN